MYIHIHIHIYIYIYNASKVRPQSAGATWTSACSAAPRTSALASPWVALLVQRYLSNTAR